MINKNHIRTYLTVMEWLGPDSQAAQLDGFLEPGGHLQALQLVVGMASQLVRSESSALLRQRK